MTGNRNEEMECCILKVRSKIDSLLFYSFFMLTKILLVLVAIVIILLVVAYFTPRNFSLSKSITINAPREKVYEYIRLLKNQEKYSVWVMADTNIAMKYTGTDGTVGATSSWTSEMKNVGVGAQTITALVPNEKVTVEIRFEKPMKATNYADTTLETVGGQTKVTNTFYGTNKFPMNITNLFLDKIIGGDIETNLANLKKNLETSVDDKTPEPEEKKIEETSQASISPSPEEAKQKLV